MAPSPSAFWALFDDTGCDGGDAVVRNRAERFAATYSRCLPAAVECITADFASPTTHLRFPARHHARIRDCNFIERTFGRGPPAGEGDRAAPRPNGAVSCSCGRRSTGPAADGEEWS
jgi:hypothetical protein